MYPEVQLFVDGAWTKAAAGRFLDVMNPSTGEPVGKVAHADRADLDRALEAADKGFKAWRKVSAFDRSKVMRKAANLLRERADTIAPLLTMEQGKPLAEAKGEVLAGADVIDWFAEEARRTYGRVIPARAEGVYQLVVKEPVGPVAAFTPWNFPINQVVRKLSCALAAGCSIIVKAPEETPASPAELIRCFADAGVPAGVINLVYGVPVRDLRVPDPASDHPQDVVHRLDRGRQAACRDRGPAHEARHDGTGRPRAGDRVRRRRCGYGKPAAGGREVPQCRPGLRVADALAGAGAGLRPVRRGLRAAQQGSEGRRRPGLRHHDGADGQRAPHRRHGDVHRRRHAARRARCRPAAIASATRATSSSRR